jgi:hypothetical protein
MEVATTDLSVCSQRVLILLANGNSWFRTIETTYISSNLSRTCRFEVQTFSLATHQIMTKKCCALFCYLLCCRLFYADQLLCRSMFERRRFSEPRPLALLRDGVTCRPPISLAQSRRPKRAGPHYVSGYLIPHTSHPKTISSIIIVFI